MNHKRVQYLLALVGIFLLSMGGWAAQKQMSLPEVSQTADLIFIGTLSSQSSHFNGARNMILTDVTFTNIRLVHASRQSMQQDSSSITMTYAGGTVGDTLMRIGDMPHFQNGNRYLIFALDDGRTYVNPIVGEGQGMFSIVNDQGSKREYVLNLAGKAITGYADKKLATGGMPIAAINRGKISYVALQQSAEQLRMPVAPESDDPNSSARISSMQEDGKANPVDLETFIRYVNDALQDGPRGGCGVSNEARSQGVGATPHFLDLPDPGGEFTHEIVSDLGGSPGNPPTISGGSLGVCGYQNLPITMEQVNPSWQEYGTNAACLQMWNNYMNVYKTRAFDGSWGNNNGQNEICSFWDDASLSRVYGVHWGNALAMAYTWSYSGCGRITESDILFNQGLKWTYDPEYARAHPEYILYRPVLMHELGHTWGYMTGDLTETYDYDVATVMQGYNSGVVEDGVGIHAADANYFRTNYKGKTPIINVKDMGVESYYGSNGLNNSYTDKRVYAPGDSIIIHKVTFENMSPGIQIEVRVRWFLSLNTTVTADDYQLGNYWHWLLFWPGLSAVVDFKTIVPSTIPPGRYYVGAIVTIEGLNSDDVPGNNITILADQITISSPVPAVFSIQPTSATAGGDSFSLTVNGSGFSPSSVVQWNNVSRPTKYISSSQLIASIARADIATSGSAQISVFTPAPGGGSSGSVVLVIKNPVPVIASVTPASMTVGSSEAMITVAGTGFISDSKLAWNGVVRSTSFISSTQVSTTLPASDLAIAGTYHITITNPAPGGGISQPVDVTINNPMPTISSVAPDIIAAGSRGVTITITGSGFMPGVGASCNGSSRGTTVVSSSKLVVVLHDSDIVVPHRASLRVANPAPSAGIAEYQNGIRIVESIYAGDANNDGSVDAGDILPIGRYFGFTGPKRLQSSLSWTPQPAPDGWNPQAAAWADCDGNGKVDEHDVAAIVTNWSNVRGSADQPTVSRIAICTEMLQSIRASNLSPGIRERIGNMLRNMICEEGGVPVSYALHQNYPNPFNPSTTIRFDIPEQVSSVNIAIMNILGEKVWERKISNVAPGRYEMVWNAGSSTGGVLPSGVYYCVLNTSEFQSVIKLMLTR